MKILILGGTAFVGKHLVEAARARGHELTLFNRGRTQRVPAADAYPDVEQIRGNREGGLDALRGRRWDAVIDTSGYLPQSVRDSAELLADAVDRYVFISTMSVYDARQRGMTEDAPLATMTAEQLRQVESLSVRDRTVGGGSFGALYGPLKVLCERAAEAAMPGRVLNVRPGLIVGPDDYTDRFTYWPVRVARGGEVLAPGRADRPIQFVDVRDLAEFTIRLTEAGRTDTVHVTGPDYRLTMGRLLDTCREVTGSDARLTWIDERFLLDQGVRPWIELPLWLASPDQLGLMEANLSRAIGLGITYRPLADTIRDTLAWDAGRPPGTERKAGMDPERERELLALWHQRAGRE